jgi:hypothetical protein
MATILILLNIMNLKLNKYFFIFIFSLFLSISLFVRVIGLDRSPISLNFDEASLGYNAYSLLLTGKDEYGVSWPISLRSFNDYKPALYSYLSIPIIKIWVLNQTTTRLTSAIFGTLSLIFLFLITKRLFKTSSLITLILVAIVSFYPWRLHYSRVAFETNVSCAFFLGAIYFLLRWAEGLKFRLAFFIFSIFSIYSYHAARLSIPIITFLFYFHQINFKNIFSKIWPVIVIVLITLPLFLSNQSTEILRRFNQTNIFSQYYPFTPGELRLGGNDFLNLQFNPFYYLGGILSGHLLSYLSPRNLTLNVFPWIDKSPQGISQSGMFGFFGGSMFLLGLFEFIKRFSPKSEFRYLLYWIVAGILPSAVTMEWLHPLRSLNAFPALEIISMLGILSIINFIFRQKNIFKIILTIVLSLILAMVIAFNLENEWNYGILQTNGEFQPGGYKEGASLLFSLKDKYPVIYLDSFHAQSFAMFLLYMNYPPANIQKVASFRPPLGTEGFINFNFDNFVYKKYNWLEDRKKSNFAFWTSAEVIEDEIKSAGANLTKIYDPLGRWAASIITKD